LDDCIRSAGSDHSQIVFQCRVSRVSRDDVVVITVTEFESELDGDLIFGRISEVGKINVDH
jgi:hypothetical protein